MADIRIKDLTTLESASLTGDVFVIDGTTGTRKLSAFSPTFGGNPTISGTLTVNGTSLASALVINGNGLALNTDGSASIRFLEGPTTSKWWIYKLSSDPNLYFRDMVNGRMQMTLVPNATSGTAISYLFSNLVVDSTASSTTTSTGALVVGNGTSGGLGVGGAINCGGLLYARGTGVNYFVADADTRLEVGNSITDQRAHVGLVQRLNLGNPIFSKNLQGQSGTDNYTTIGTTVSSGYSGVECGYGGLIRLLTGTGATTAGAVVTPTTSLLASTTQISIPLSTISNSTSSGALVVSGGVGVAGAIFAGGDIAIPADKGLYLKQGNVHKWTSDGTPTGTSRADIYADSGGAFFIRTGGATQALTISSSGNATFASTTNASSTSFAALVVSGGVGVAKRIVSGEGLTTNGDNETHISFVRNGTVNIGPTSAAAPKLSISSGVVLAAATQNLAAWGDVGAQFAVSGSVLTDTQSSGTVSRCVLNSFASTNVAAAGTTTFTQAATLFVAGAPTAGTNVTITNAYALYTAGGRINFQGLPTSSAGLQAGTLWNDGGTLKVA